MGTEVGGARGQPSERSETICPMERSGMGCGQAPASGVLPPWAETVQVGVFVRRRACNPTHLLGAAPFARLKSRMPLRDGSRSRGGCDKPSVGASRTRPAAPGRTPVNLQMSH